MTSVPLGGSSGRRKDLSLVNGGHYTTGESTLNSPEGANSRRTSLSYREKRLAWRAKVFVAPCLPSIRGLSGHPVSSQTRCSPSSWTLPYLAQALAVCLLHRLHLLKQRRGLQLPAVTPTHFVLFCNRRRARWRRTPTRLRQGEQRLRISPSMMVELLHASGSLGPFKMLSFFSLRPAALGGNRSQGEEEGDGPCFRPPSHGQKTSSGRKMDPDTLWVPLALWTRTQNRPQGRRGRVSSFRPAGAAPAH